MSGNLIVSKAEAMNPSKRNTMEDAHVVHHAGKWNCNDPELAYFGIYDGHGGRDTVDFIEEALHENVAEELNMDDNTSIHNKIERAFLMTDAESKMAGIQTSGATVAICLIKKHSCGKKVTIHAANVGDARAVLSCQPTKYMKPTTASHQDSSPLKDHTPKSKRLRSQLVQTPKTFRLTYDHKSDDEDEIKRIEDAGGFLMKNRVLGIMAVARSLGDHGMKEFVIGKPYVNTVEVSLDDKSDTGNDDASCSEFIIIGCDGIWDVIEDQEAVEIVRKYASNGSSRYKETAAKMLCRLAIQRGSTDNVTILVIWF